MCVGLAPKGLITDILAVVNTLYLALQKQTALLIDIKHLVQITTETATKLSTTNSPIDFGQILARRKSYHACFVDYKSIVADCLAISLLKKLITEIEEAFVTSYFPIIDAFQVLNPKNIPIN